MASKCFVINEWIIHDLMGDNGREAQEESSRFLSRLKESCDQIVILEGSKWLEKAYDLMRKGDPIIRTLSKQLRLEILRDPKKCKILNKDEIKPLSEKDRDKIPYDDQYLVELYFSADADALVTSDSRLIENISLQPPVEIILRNDFLKGYLKKDS